MTLQEPTVEFVPIDQNEFIQAASSCPDWYTQTPTGGGQRCIGTQPEAANCVNMIGDIDWSNPENG